MDLIIYHTEYQVQICTQHQYAIRDLARHLRDDHTSITLAQRKEILAHHQHDICVEPTRFEPPAHPVPPVSGLQPPRLVLQCQDLYCHRRLVSEVQMAQHCNQQHGWRKSSSNPVYWTKTLAQTFFAGALTKYFAVQGTTVLPTLTIPSGESSSAETGFHLRQREQPPFLSRLTPLQQQQAQQLLQEREQANQQYSAKLDIAVREITKQDRTGWYTRTGWPQHFANRNLVQIAYRSRLPDKHETVLLTLVQAFDLLWRTAVNGLQSIDLETRRWLRSPKATDPDRRPLARLQTDAALERYSDYFRRLLCYSIRVWQATAEVPDPSETMPNSSAPVVVLTAPDDELGEDSEDEPESDTSHSAEYYVGSVTSQRQRPGPSTVAGLVISEAPTADAQQLFPWQPGQKILLQRLYDAATDSDETDAERADLLLQFFRNVIFFKIGQNQFSSSLVHFAAVLGINPDTRRLRPATDYSSILAGMVYCIRIFAVEILFPHEQRQSEAQYAECREYFLQQRLQYLIDGTYTPTSVLLSLLAYSKSITLATSNAGTV